MKRQEAFVTHLLSDCGSKYLSNIYTYSENIEQYDAYKIIYDTFLLTYNPSLTENRKVILSYSKYRSWDKKPTAPLRFCSLFKDLGYHVRTIKSIGAHDTEPFYYSVITFTGKDLQSIKKWVDDYEAKQAI